ncbi:MAG: methyltransferase [Planctomycetaceae bacterium]
MEFKSTTIDLGRATVRLRVPAEPDRILNDAVAAEQNGGPSTDPYWGLLWNAATPTARLVLGHMWKPGTAVVELGCGTGLVGIAGLMAGLDVTFTDLVPEAVALAVENAVLNGFAGACGKVLDWRTPEHPRVEVLLASDVLYDEDSHDALLSAAETLLSEQGTLWIGDPGREPARRFLQRAAEAWSIRLCADDGTEIIQPQRGRFQLLELKRRTAANHSSFSGRFINSSVAARGDLFSNSTR